MSISGFTCGNCGFHSDEHVNSGQCIFSPTKFRMMDAVELAAARGFRRQAPRNAPVQLKTPTFHSISAVGVSGPLTKFKWNGGGGTPAVGVLVPRNVVASFAGDQLPAHPPRIFTVSGTDQFGDAVTEEI